MTDTTTRIWRKLTDLDSNAEPEALYTLCLIAGEAHTMIIGRVEDSWQLTVHRGIEDEISDWDPVGIIDAGSLYVAKKVAEFYMASTEELVDTMIECVDRIREHSAGVYALRLAAETLEAWDGVNAPPLVGTEIEVRYPSEDETSDTIEILTVTGYVYNPETEDSAPDLLAVCSDVTGQIHTFGGSEIEAMAL